MKKILALLLTFCFIFSLSTTSAFANEVVIENNKLSDIPFKIDSNLQCESTTIQTQLEVLEKYGFATEYLTFISKDIQDNQIVYKYQLPESVNPSFIKVFINNDSTIFNVNEGSNCDILEYKKNGDIFLDGKKIQIELQKGLSSNTSIPLKSGTRTEYSDSSFISTGAYYVDESGRENRVSLSQKISQITVSALASILFNSVSTTARMVRIGLGAANFVSHATSIKGLAERTANFNKEYISYTWSSSHHQNNDAFIKYYKYRFTYFTELSCQGEGITKYLYRRTIVY